MVLVARPVVVAILIATTIGILCLMANIRQPIVRNSLVYARAAENIVAHDFNPIPVVADYQSSYGKPIGFPWLVAPLVAVVGTNLGLMIGSAGSTVAFIFAAWFFVRWFDPFAFDERERAQALCLATIGPLVVYQFWSGHPDSLFAALVLVSFTLTHIVVAKAECGIGAGNRCQPILNLTSGNAPC